MNTIAGYIRVVACVLVGMCVVGCSTPTRTVVIDTIADEALIREMQAGTGARTYVIKPGESGVRGDDLRFREVAAEVESMLASKGYQRVEESAEGAAAAAVVYLTYGVGTPRTVTRVYSTPVYGFSGGEHYRYRQTQVGPDGRIETRGHVYEDSEWNRVGTDVRSQTTTYYQLFFGLDAFAPAAVVDGPAGKPLWSVEVTSEGESDDLRRWLPLMVRAAEPWVEKSSPGQVRVEISATDAEPAQER